MNRSGWRARLRAFLVKRSSHVTTRPGAISLAVILAIGLLVLVWPAARQGEAAELAASAVTTDVTATATIAAPTMTASPTATVAPTVTVAAAGSPTLEGVAGQEDGDAPLSRPPRPRGFGPRLNPQVMLLPKPTADPLALLVPTPTPTPAPTLTVIQALDQPLPAARLGLGARLLAPARTPTPGVPAAPAVVAPSPILEPTPAIEPTPSGDVRTVRVPILMYHYLSVPPPNADIYRRDLSVTPELFAEHLDALAAAGYTTISLYQWLAALTQGEPLPEKPVVLTFDDGYRDNYVNAFPLLRARGMTATFFIVTDFIDDQRPEYLTWDMVREMYAGGMSIEAHGRNHVSLAGKDVDYLVWQALGSLETIEYELGVRPRFVSYPAGEFDQLTIDIFRSANYWAGFTTRQGATHRSDDLFRSLRVRVRGTTTTAELLRLLTVDW